jgi:purine-binding chemotaxis protein CheW
MQFLQFDLSDRRFGLALEAVREVVRAVAVTPLPGAPPVVEGAIDVRGELAPVLDVRARFGVGPAPLRPDQHMVIARAGPRLVALRVDRVVALREVAAAAPSPAGALAPGLERLAGIARLEDGLVVIQDLEAFLSQAEEEALDRALAEGTP